MRTLATAFAHVAISPHEDVDSHPHLALTDNAQVFSSISGKIDDGSFTTIFSVRTTVHHDDLNRFSVRRIRNTRNRAEWIGPVRSNRLSIVELQTACCP